MIGAEADVQLLMSASVGKAVVFGKIRTGLHLAKSVEKVAEVKILETMI